MLPEGISSVAQSPFSDLDRGAVLTKAVLRSADILGLNARILARVIGVSEPTLSRMKRGDVLLDRAPSPTSWRLLWCESTARLMRSAAARMP